MIVKVLDIDCSHIVLEKVFLNTYSDIRECFYQKDGIHLPTLEEIQSDSYSSHEMYVAHNDIVIIIKTWHEKITIEIKRGCLIDFINIPKLFSSFITNYFIVFLVQYALYLSNKGFTFSVKLTDAILKREGVGLTMRLFISFILFRLSKKLYIMCKKNRTNQRELIKITREDS